MKKLNTILCLTVLVLCANCQYTWLNKNPFSGIPSCNGAAFSIGNTAYVVGGINNRTGPTYTNQVWSYNPNNDSWTQKSNFPIIAAGLCSFVIHDTAYVFGGQETNLTLTSNTYTYNSTSDTWTAKAAFTGGPGNNFATFVINGTGYVVTGAQNGGNTSVTGFAYNPSSDTWSPIASYSGPASVNSVGFAIDSFGYVGLGSNGSGTYYSQFYKYAPASNSWSSIASYPGVVRAGSVAFVLDGIAYVGSGATTVSGTSSIYSLGDFYSYNPANDTWTPVPGLPGNCRGESTSFTLNNNGYVVGGYDNNSSSFLSTVSEFGTCQSLSAVMPIPGGSNQWEIMVYPNPSSGNMNVKINAQLNSAVQYDLVSVDGKQIKTGSTHDNQFELNTANLADGIYVITIRDNNGTEGVKRFEVIH